MWPTAWRTVSPWESRSMQFLFHWDRSWRRWCSSSLWCADQDGSNGQRHVLKSRWHLFLIILAVWPLVLSSLFSENMLSKLIVDHPLYIRNTSSRQGFVRSLLMTTDQAVPVFLGKVTALDLVSFWWSDAVHVPTAAYPIIRWPCRDAEFQMWPCDLYKRSMTYRLL